MQEPTFINIYVRKPETSTPEREVRRLSFEIPKSPQRMGYNLIFDLGFAVDGTHAFRDVAQDDSSRPFPEQLREVQREIVAKLMKSGGFAVGEFR